MLTAPTTTTVLVLTVVLLGVIFSLFIINAFTGLFPSLVLCMLINFHDHRQDHWVAFRVVKQEAVEFFPYVLFEV